MKKLNALFKFVLMLLILSVFTECQNHDAVKKQQPDVVNYDQIGIDHNKGLDVIFDALKNDKASSSGRVSAKDRLDLISSIGTQFTLQNHPELSTNAIALLKERAVKSISFSKTYLSGRVNGSKDIYQQLMDSANALLNANQKFYIQKILTTMTSEKDINSILSSFDSIEKEIRSNCSDTELPVILASLSVAKHSAQYWNENYEKWVTEFGGVPSGGRIELKINWGVVGAADVAEATIVGGGTIGLGLAPGIGWAAWGIITGGAALLTSGGSALVYVAS